MLEDARYALRNLQRRPGLAIVVAVTLGLGIGSATAVFSVVDAVVLRTLPFSRPDRLVRVWELTREGDRFSVSPSAYLDLARTSRTLQTVAAYGEHGVDVVLTDAGRSLAVTAVPVSATFGDVLGVRPQHGRMFTEGEQRPDGVGRVVLADGLWRASFAADPAVLGRVLTVDGRAVEVIGVMPPGFGFPGQADAWVPLALDQEADRTDKTLAVIARLAADATHAQVAGELREIADRWSRDYPDAHDGWSAVAVPFDEWIISPRYRDAVWMLFGAVALLLLLACANVANFLVARAVSRQDEMRLRAALGAGRGRLVRQLFTESAALAVLGTASGILVAVWLIEAVQAFAGNALPRLDTISLNAPVIGFACVAGIISCMAFGLAPAFYASRMDLRAGGHGGVRHTVRSSGVRHVLVVVEVAVALLLLVGAGLLGNSFVRLMQVNPGFDVDATLAMPIEHRSRRYSDDRAADFYGDLLQRVRAIPGVVAAGATTTNPFRQFGFSNNVTPEERAADTPPSGLVQAGWRSVTPGFFQAMGIPILAGRSFDDSDDDGTERVVVVSESLARRLWPGESPIGRRLFWGGTTGRTRTVVGVSGDIRDVQLDAAPPPLLFVPHAQVSVPQLTLVIRTAQPTEQIAPALRAALRDIDPALPAPPVYRVSTSRAQATLAPRFNLSLLVAFAGVALVLALTGVYAMLAFMVSERRREMAVRLALGATGAEVARHVIGGGLRLSLAGVVIGVGIALAATTLLSRQLYEVTPTDPLTFAAAALSTLGAGVLASYLPARQAARIDAAVLLSRDA
jgi:putative ABC transport system permease protein